MSFFRQQKAHDKYDHSRSSICQFDNKEKKQEKQAI